MEVWDEQFGLVREQQLAMYRSRKVTQEDHRDLVEEFGDDWVSICHAVARRSVADGTYRPGSG